MKSVFAFALLMSVFSGRAADASVAARLYINGSESGVVQAGQPTELIYEIYNPESPEPFHHFHPMHAKEVHAFAVSDDLSTFAHFHPVEIGNHLGLFSIRINEPNSDPDSQDAATAIMNGGKYFLYTESMPMTERMTVNGIDVTAEGAPRPASNPVVATPLDENGVATIVSEEYRITISQESLPHPGTFVVMLHAHIEVFEPAAGGFVPVTDLTPWLLSYGHAVMVQTKGASAADKRVLHLHASYPIIDDASSGQGPDVDLVADSPVAPPEDLYKTWLQFEHRGKVRTVPMAFEVQKPGRARR